MVRQQKYPDTATFHFYNANPKRRVTGDCVIRALSTAMDVPYEVVYRELFEFSQKCGYMLNSKECYSKYLQSKGWIKQKQPRKDDNTKYTGVEFCEQLQDDPWLFTGKEYDFNARIIAKIGSHHIVAIVDGMVHDTWDSTDGCIGNYWTKGQACFSRQQGGGSALVLKL